MRAFLEGAGRALARKKAEADTEGGSFSLQDVCKYASKGPPKRHLVLF